LVLGLILAVSLFVINFNTLVPLIARDVLHEGAHGFGLLMASLGIGAVVGALALTLVGPARPAVSVLITGASWGRPGPWPSAAAAGSCWWRCSRSGGGAGGGAPSTSPVRDQSVARLPAPLHHRAQGWTHPSSMRWRPRVENLPLTRGILSYKLYVN